MNLLFISTQSDTFGVQHSQPTGIHDISTGKEKKKLTHNSLIPIHVFTSNSYLVYNRLVPVHALSLHISHKQILPGMPNLP